MFSDERIAADVATLEPVLGATQASWYKEACKIECNEDARVILWACRTRMLAYQCGLELLSLAEAAETLLAAVETNAPEAIQKAKQDLQTALWWRA